MVTDQSGFRYCNAASLKMFHVPDRVTFVEHHLADFSPDYQPDGRLGSEAAAAAAAEYIDASLNKGKAFSNGATARWTAWNSLPRSN